MVSGNNPNISYLGLPKALVSGGFYIKSHLEILTLILDLARTNSKIGSNMICLDLNEIDLHEDFFTAINDEEDPNLSDIIDSINLLLNKNSMRVSFFIGKEYFMGSQLEGVKESTIKVINSISSLLDLIGVDYPSIIVRIGSAYGNRKQTMSNFCERVKLLDKNALKKLCVTNDEKPSLFSVTDLLTGIYYETKIPICFRTLAHHFNNGGLSIREAMFLSSSTWDENDVPFFIHSESSEINDDGISLSPNPSEYLKNRIPTFGLSCDIIIESPERENSYIDYLKNQKSLPPMVINKTSAK
jgi:UV DNA damage repair endonuclease